MKRRFVLTLALVALLLAALPGAAAAPLARNVGEFTAVSGEPLFGRLFAQSADLATVRLESASLGQAEYSPGATMQIQYSGGLTGAGKYISAAIVNDADVVLYYAPLGYTLGDGVAHIALPNELAPGDYTLYVFNEQTGGEPATISQPIALALTVRAAAALTSAVHSLDSSSGGNATMTLTFSRPMDTQFAGEVYIANTKINPASARWENETTYVIGYKQLVGSSLDVNVKNFKALDGGLVAGEVAPERSSRAAAGPYPFSLLKSGDGSGQFFYSVNGAEPTYTAADVMLPMNAGDDITFGFIPDAGSCFSNYSYTLNFGSIASDGYVYTLADIQGASQFSVVFSQCAYSFSAALADFTGGNDVAATTDGEYGDFMYVKINGIAIDPAYVTVTEGSTVITLHPEAFAQFGDGVYPVEAVFGSIINGQAASAHIRIARTAAAPPAAIAVTPLTGDTNRLVLLGAIATAALGCVLAIGTYKKKRTQKEQ